MYYTGLPTLPLHLSSLPALSTVLTGLKLLQEWGLVENPLSAHRFLPPPPLSSCVLVARTSAIARLPGWCAGDPPFSLVQITQYTQLYECLALPILACLCSVLCIGYMQMEHKYKHYHSHVQRQEMATMSAV